MGTETNTGEQGPGTPLEPEPGVLGITEDEIAKIYVPDKEQKEPKCLQSRINIETDRNITLAIAETSLWLEQNVLRRKVCEANEANFKNQIDTYTVQIDLVCQRSMLEKKSITIIDRIIGGCQTKLDNLRKEQEALRKEIEDDKEPAEPTIDKGDPENEL